MRLKRLLPASGGIDKILGFVFDIIFKVIRKNIKKNWVPGSIAVLVLHRLGDTVFTIPAIKSIFENYNEHKIYILTYTGTKAILQYHFSAESIIEIPREHFYFGRIAGSKARGVLKNLKPEIIFDLNTTVVGASMVFNSRAGQIAGVNEPYYKNIYDCFHPRRNTPNLMDMYLDVVQQVYHIPDRKKLMYFSRENIKKEDTVLIHPFAGWKAKEWNINKFVELAELLEKAGFKVSFIFEKGRLPDDIKAGLKVNIIETTSIAHLIEEIDKCLLFISNDSGPLYIAGSRGKATFSIYGPTNPDFSVLQGDHHSYIQKKLDCSPKEKQYCIAHGGYTCPSFECMNLLSGNTVYDALAGFLQKINPGNDLPE